MFFRYDVEYFGRDIVPFKKRALSLPFRNMSRAETIKRFSDGKTQEFHSGAINTFLGVKQCIGKLRVLIFYVF